MHHRLKFLRVLLDNADMNLYNVTKKGRNTIMEELGILPVVRSRA